MRLHASREISAFAVSKLEATGRAWGLQPGQLISSEIGEFTRYIASQTSFRDLRRQPAMRTLRDPCVGGLGIKPHTDRLHLSAVLGRLADLRYFRVTASISMP